MAGRYRPSSLAAWGNTDICQPERPECGGSFGLGIIGAQDFLGALENLRPFVAQCMFYCSPACLVCGEVDWEKL